MLGMPAGAAVSRSARPAAAQAAVRLADYAPPPFLVDTADFVFDLGEETTRVRSRLSIRRNPAAPEGMALRLDGQGPELVSLALDGEPLGPNRFRHDEDGLTIADLPAECVLDIETSIRPQDNTELSGLYKSGGNFCTQCEAEGFRRITFFPDRPDVMARYVTTIVADRERYPALLSNGNPVDRGTTADGRHWVKWEDPFPKPSYLFALVAGDLAALEDSFTTRSGRKVALAIWARREDLAKCGHAMDSLKAAMAWDEVVFGLEYDLDMFNIVAVSDFNMGAMENKSLNIFNTRYVLAAPETATDADYQGVERVIAHEYFHNWTGNRVTCRDWFQLSLKEGLTVFRDQEFMADRHGRGAMRIEDVRLLRANQFPEDDGPLAHPVQPESYLEINNFYTATVYNKGAELVRMIRTLIGADVFRRGMDLYFQRHDNQAVTIQDFVAAMQDASGVDLSGFQVWYRQAGTPEIRAEDEWDSATGRFRLTVSQQTPPTPGQAGKAPVPIPLALGLLGPDGSDLPVRPAGNADEPAAAPVLVLKDTSASFEFDSVPVRPVPSLLRGFSAPVRQRDVPLDRLKFLARHESDQFARWDAIRRVGVLTVLDLVQRCRRGEVLSIDPDLVDIIGRTLRDAEPAFAAEAMTLPSETRIADEMDVVDVEAIHAARTFARWAVGVALAPELEAACDRLAEPGAYKIDPAAMARRALRNCCLSLLGATGSEQAIARANTQFYAGANMTDVLAALAVLNEMDRPEREAAFARFYETWQRDELVADKWFSLQAMSSLPATPDRIDALARHPAFDLLNPNRARALIGSFANNNPLHFHAASGRGYRFLVDGVLKLDRTNAQVAARLVQPLGQWRRHEPRRKALMRAALQEVLAAPGLSRNTFEMTSKSLA